MMGVNYDLFWTLNPKSLLPFIKAFSLKQKYDDTVCWQQGLYLKMAIASSFNKSAKYPLKPLSSNKLKQEVSIEDKRSDIKNKMIRQMNIINKRFGKEDDSG